LIEFNDGVWSTLSDFADLQSLGRLGSVSEALRAKQLAVSRAVSLIESDAPGAFSLAAKLRRVLATKHIHAGHVAALLSRPQWHVRMAVLEALRDVGAEASLPHLDAALELLDDPDAQVRLAALRLLRLFAPRTSVFAARFAAMLSGCDAADSEAQRSFILEAFVALAAFGSHALPYGEQIVKARGVIARSVEVEAASVLFAEIGIAFLPSLTACLKSKADPSMVHYSVRHGLCLDTIRLYFPEGIFRGAEVHALAIFEDLKSPVPHSLAHRDVSFTWSAWRTTVSEQTDSSFTLAEGPRHNFGDGYGCREEHTISSGGYDISCTSFADQKLPSIVERIVSMAVLNKERLEFYDRLGWSNEYNHIATCCSVLTTMMSDSDIEEKRLMFEGCSCAFCTSVLQVLEVL
jgi:hypothetical protein